MVEAFFEEIRAQLESGESVKLSGFGNFQLRDIPQRPGRNPKTGEEIPITARRVVTFHPSQKREAKDMVEAFFEEIRAQLEQGESVKLSGFGNFQLRDKPQRPGRNLEHVVGEVAVEDVVALSRCDSRIVEVGENVAAVPTAAIGELDAVDLMIGIEEVLADRQRFAAGEHRQHQIVADPVQADVGSIEICEADAVEVVCFPSAVIDHVIAVTQSEAVDIPAAPADQQIVTRAAVQDVVTAVAAQAVIAAQADEGVAAGATRQSIGKIITSYSGHERAPLSMMDF